MAITYEPIATQTLSSAAASVTFSSISGAYTDLVIIATITNSTNDDRDLYVQVNGDTGSNYSRTLVYGAGTTAQTGSSSNNSQFRIGNAVLSSTTQTPNILNFMNYSNTSTYKTVIHRGGHNSSVGTTVGLWRNTAAITSIVLYMQPTSNLNTGSTFTLYGIKAA